MDNTNKYTTKIRIRYNEVDKMGVVHHSRYFVFFEIGRTDLLRQSGFTYKEFEDKNLFLPIINVSCSFKYPIKYDDIILVETTMDKMTSVKIEHSYTVRNHDKTVLHATAKTTLACVNRNGEIQKIPCFLHNLIGSQRNLSN